MHFLFYAEIQDGCKNGGKPIFAQIRQMTPHIPCRPKILFKLQDGCQKWWEKDFWQKVPDNCS